ncbi:MAG: hypothetical protein LBN26_05280 [Christensenellaceae bacterium]|jgi:hypothetical protein|nr:hypothetical protein [Christensenellaceae bacterium]
MNSKKLLAILISVLMMCVLLTACDDSSDSPSGQTLENYGDFGGDDREEKLEELQALYDTLVTVQNGSTALINQCQDYGVEVSDEIIESINDIKAILDEYRGRFFADDAADTLDLDSEIAGIAGDIEAVRELNAAISSRLEELGLELNYVEVG